MADQSSLSTMRPPSNALGPPPPSPATLAMSASQNPAFLSLSGATSSPAEVQDVSEAEEVEEAADAPTDEDIDEITEDEREPESLEDAFERIQEKDEAAKYALAFLSSICAQFQEVEAAQQMTSGMDFEAWKSSLKSIEHDFERFEHMVGVVGDTGMGKTSLLNALISGTKDIAPSSQAGACTAAVTCFYYRKAQKGKPFSAKIHLKTKDAVDDELAAFFRDVRDFERSAAIDGEVDQAEQEKLEEQIKLISGWSGMDIHKVRDLGDKELTADITMNCSHGDQLFNFEKTEQPRIIEICAGTEKAFMQALRPYVGNCGKKQLWPLVSVADVFFDNELLNNGITLVDLPGEMDALEARSQVARQFSQKLDSRIVVTPSDRAIDNRTAAELIREDQIMEMEADDKMGEGSLCVVTTKIDLFDWEAYLATEHEPDEISPELPDMKDRFDEITDALEVLDEEITQLKEEIGDLEPEDYGSLDGQSSELRNRRQELAMEQDVLNAACFKACSALRNNKNMVAVQAHVDRVRSGRKNTSQTIKSTPVEFFPVSSRAQRQLLGGHADPRFPDAKATGFEGLQNWIMCGSLPQREGHIDQALARCNVLFDAVQGWIPEIMPVTLSHSIDKLPRDYIPKLKAFLQHVNPEFRKEMGRSPTNFKDMIVRSMVNQKAVRKNSSYAAIDGFVQHVDNFRRDGTVEHPQHWATYSANIRRHGGHYRPKGKLKRTFWWQNKTFSYYWQPLFKEWGKRLIKGVSHYYQMRLRPADRKRLNDYVEVLETCPGLPQPFTDILKSHHYQFDNLLEKYLEDVRTAESQFRQTLNHIRHGTRILINQAMEDGYAAANKITGPKKTLRQMDTMRTHAEMAKYVIFEGMGEMIDAEIDQAKISCEKKHKAAVSSFCDKMTKAIEGFIKNVCTDVKIKSGNAKPDPAVEDLKQSVAQDVRGWRDHWQKLREKFPPPVEEVTNESDKKQLLDGASKYRKVLEFNITGNIDFDALLEALELQKQQREDKKNNPAPKTPKAPKAPKVAKVTKAIKAPKIGPVRKATAGKKTGTKTGTKTQKSDATSNGVVKKEAGDIEPKIEDEI